MSTIVKLNMIFDTETMPDFGDIDFDRNKNLLVKSDDLPKLITNFKKSVLGKQFNLSVGTKAIIIDTGAELTYFADDWYLTSPKKYNFTPWQNPDEVSAGCVEIAVYYNNKAYVLADDETLTVKLFRKADNTLLRTDTMTKQHYKGGGYYVVYYTGEEVNEIMPVSDCRTEISIIKGDNNDITDNFTIKSDIMTWLYNES